MPADFKRFYIQASLAQLRKDETDDNYATILDVPPDAVVVIHDFAPIDETVAWARVSVVQQLDPEEPLFEDEDGDA